MCIINIKAAVQFLPMLIISFLRSMPISQNEYHLCDMLGFSYASGQTICHRMTMPVIRQMKMKITMAPLLMVPIALFMIIRVLL